MAHKKSTTNLTELLLECVSQPDPMLSMLEWLCDQLMEAEMFSKIGADKSEHTSERNTLWQRNMRNAFRMPYKS